MTYSLQTRGLFFVSLVLAAFLGATGLVLDQAFRDSALAAVRDRLQGYVYALLAGSEPGARGILKPPENLQEPRFEHAGSGLYAEFRRGNRKPDWRSPSTVGIEIPRTTAPPIGTSRLTTVNLADGSPVFVLSFSVLWEEGKKKKPIRYTFRVAETLDTYEVQINQFRRSLWRWLGGAAVVLVLLQGAILRWGFSPLRRVANDLTAIEEGKADKLTGRYPVELLGLTDNLNALLDNSRAHLTRYRDALGDLAHSLKTPLAVLRGALQSDTPDREELALAREQIERMNLIVQYQLKRAAASGRSQLAPPVDVATKVRQVTNALLKVYADKGVDCQWDVIPGLAFHGDEGDLLEILGNLTDNAFKWCRGKVRVTARADEAGRLELRIEDDGPGIDDDDAARLGQRGERADPSTPGHGLGLAIVQTVAGAYGGQMAIGRSEMGGAEIWVRGLG